MKPIHALFSKSIVGKIWKDADELEWKVTDLLGIFEDDGTIFIRIAIVRHEKTLIETLDIYNDVLE